MNFYGDSFHLNRQPYNYSWNYVPAEPNRMVVTSARVNKELAANCTPSPACATYQPLQVNLPMGAFVTPSSCQPGVNFVTPSPTTKPWPTKCADINDAAIHGAMNGSAGAKPSVGFILLNGKRLGNLSAIEAIPNKAIQGIQQNQINQINALPGPNIGAKVAGEIQYNGGSRDGVGGPNSVVKECKGNTKSLNNCYLGRFGWLGDRVSLEDQAANAAFIEMNMTTKTGYGSLYPNGSDDPIRYNGPNCGPADLTCVKSGGNADLLELDIDRMAAYARWLGNPTRSEFTASLPDVIAGENIFRQIGCNSCHVIDVIEIPDPDDTMLSKVFRDRLATRVDPTASDPPQ
jgi:hypothetical protein